MILVSDLKNSSLPKEFLAVLPETCTSCGSPTEVTPTLSLLRCTNSRCGSKATRRLVALLKDLGVKNMGESKCRKFLEHFQIDNPYGIFLYEPHVDGPLFEGCSMEFSEMIFEQLNACREMLLWEYVRLGNMQGIRDSARRLLVEYDDLETFFDDMEEGGISFVQNLLSVGDTSIEGDTRVSVKAVQVYNTLLENKEDLMQGLEGVIIKKLSTPVLNICLSTAVGKPYKSKQDFTSKMQAQFGEKVHINVLGSVTRDCHCLIWSKEGNKTTKVKKAESINEKKRVQNIKNGLNESEGLIKILTGEEFREYLENL